MSVTLADIEAARARISDTILHSPCPYSLALSRLTGAQIYCKIDTVQMTGSFKERGARNRLLQLTDDEKKRGVIAASAGNHALGLAYHGQLLGIPVTVVMPKWAPLIKVSTCKSFNAKVIQHGESFDEARSLANEICAEKHLTYVHGFNDPEIIAGQGTIGLEILEDVPDVDAVIIPVGGGGLIAGAAVAIKAIKPAVKIIGVESVRAPTLQASLRAGKVVRIDTEPTLADGLAIAELGANCFPLIQSRIDELVLVEEQEIGLAIFRLLELEKLVVEGAGAVSLSALLRKDHGLAGKKVVLILCGGNIDASALGRVIERGLVADGRLCRIVAFISDRPGGLAKLTSVISSTGASVKEIIHDRSFSPGDVARVAVSCVLETRDRAHINEIYAALTQAQIQTASPGV